jgi:hypothetical protein
MDYNCAVSGFYAGSPGLIVNGNNVVSDAAIIAVPYWIAHFELFGHAESLSQVWTYCQSRRKPDCTISQSRTLSGFDAAGV